MALPAAVLTYEREEAVEDIREIPMDQISNYLTNSSQWRRRSTSPLALDETDVTNPGRTQMGKAAKKQSFLLATVAAALALLPLSFYGLVGAQGDSLSGGSVNEAAAEDLIQFNHMVLGFADPKDAEDCFAPNPVGVTSFDADGNAGPSAFSSKNALPGAPLP